MADINNEAVDIFMLADQLSELNPRFTSQKKKCRRNFIEFMEINGYFGVRKPEVTASDCDTKSQEADEVFFISQSDAERIRPNLELWLRSYGTDSDEKLKLLTERMTALFPETGTLFCKYIKYSQADSSFAWKLADYLCFTLNSEISEINSDDLDRLAADMDRELPLLSARLFSGFLMYARERGVLSNGWVYNFNSRRDADADIDGAYATLDFLKMAYLVFNDEAWEEQHLLEKALQSERDANLWLFVACHFICGWRGSDIIRLPMPTLTSSGSYIREQIAAGHFDTGCIINELEYRLRYTPLMPQKTEMHDNVPELKLFVPESLRYPFGIIFTIDVSHHESVKPGDVFLRKPGDRLNIQSFFGEEFAKACGGRGFSSRRANKSYLQGIEMMANTSASQPKGYMLAALARSHKGGYGSLPETTDIYLRDAKFSGYRPEFIAREMFERGVFSFIPSLMMEMYAKDNYTELPVPVQTKILAEIGIEASGLEVLTKTVEQSLIKARSAIMEVMKRPEDIRGSIADILQNIASGNAPGKQDGFLCLMTASGSTCIDALRSCCIGCGYEIYTKTILHCLSKEYKRLLVAKNKAEPAEAARCAKILKEAVMPAIAEMFISLKQLYPDVDIKALINVTEMGAMLC
jgi:hypothetical protein